jgi:hypothetical protein
MIFKVQEIIYKISPANVFGKEQIIQEVALYCYENQAKVILCFYGKDNQDAKKYSEAFALQTDIIVDIKI